VSRCAGGRAGGGGRVAGGGGGASVMWSGTYGRQLNRGISHRGDGRTRWGGVREVRACWSCTERQGKPT
jgi:hypothetical protein